MPRRKPAVSKRRTSKRTTPPEVFIPAAFVAPAPVVAPVVAAVEVYVPPEVEVEAPRARGLDVELLREYVEEQRRAGFNERGVCRYGCEGMMSVIGRVRPPVAMHDVSCPYWDTAEGIKDMRALERQHD